MWSSICTFARPVRAESRYPRKSSTELSIFAFNCWCVPFNASIPAIADAIRFSSAATRYFTETLPAVRGEQEKIQQQSKFQRQLFPLYLIEKSRLGLRQPSRQTVFLRNE